MLRLLYRHNAWANARVFAVCLGLAASLLDEEAGGTSGTVGRTLRHLVAVEDAYLAMLRGNGPEAVGPMEEYLARGERGHAPFWDDAATLNRHLRAFWESP